MPWKDELITRFLSECGKRQSNGQSHVCVFLSDEVGVSVGAHPEMCAACMLSGKINEEYLSGHAAGLMVSQMRRVMLGFYHDDPAAVEHIFKSAWKHMRMKSDGPKRFRASLLQWVELGRISAQKAGELLAAHAPDLDIK